METECIQIKRGSFNPITFFNNPRWSIDANRTDIRSVVLNEFHPKEILLMNVTREDRRPEDGIERLSFVVARENYLRLDVGVFHALWTNQHLIPYFWKQLVKNESKVIYFDGSVFKDEHSDDFCVVCLYWGGDRWSWEIKSLRRPLFGFSCSAVLADKHYPLQCL